jgi:hypothetical protein
MSMLVNDLSTGDVMVFDKEKRDLYLIPKPNAKQWHEAKEKTIAFAKQLADKGVAKHFDKAALATLQAAMAHVVLLGASS